MVEREDAGSLFSTEQSVSAPDQELSQRILAHLERTATKVPAGAAGVRGIRSTDLVQLVEEAMGPERLALRSEAEKYRLRVSALEQELAAVRSASDETRRFELPRLAALVDVERTRAGQLERELSEVERKVEELESALRHSEDARERDAEELTRAHDEESEEAQSQAEELLLALDQRLAALEQGAFAPGEEAAPGDGGEGADSTLVARPAASAARAREEEEATRLLLEQFARSEERAARIEALEQALEELGGELPDDLPGQSGNRPRGSSTSIPRALLAEALERQGRAEARTAELVKTLQVTQELLSREVRRRTAIERELRAVAVRLAAVEAAPALNWNAADLAQLGPGDGEGLARVVALLRGEGARRERDLQGQLERLSLATRSALERMAEILDQALALGARPRARTALDEVGLLRPTPPGWTAWVGEGLDPESGFGADEGDAEAAEPYPDEASEAADEHEYAAGGDGAVDAEEEEEDGADIRGSAAGPHPVDPLPGGGRPGAELRSGAEPAPRDAERAAPPRAGSGRQAGTASDWLAELSHESAQRGTSGPVAIPDGSFAERPVSAPHVTRGGAPDRSAPTPPRAARRPAEGRDRPPPPEAPALDPLAALDQPLPDPAEATRMVRSPDPATRRLARSLLGALRDQASLKAERDRALHERGRLEDKARHAELALESEVWRGFATHRELVQARQRLRELEGQLEGQLERVERERSAGSGSDELPLAVPSPAPSDDALLARQAERVADLQREVQDRDSVLHWLMLEADPHYHHDKERAIRACEQALESLANGPETPARASEREQLTDLLHWLRVEQRREGASEPPFSA